MKTFIGGWIMYGYRNGDSVMSGFYSFADGFMPNNGDVRRNECHQYWVEQAESNLEGTYDRLMALELYPMAAWIISTSWV